MNGVRIDTERIEIIEKFWQDPGVKDCFARRNEFQLTDSASYFLDNARRITNDDFEPTNEVRAQDVKMSCVRPSVLRACVCALPYSTKGSESF